MYIRRLGKILEKDPWKAIISRQTKFEDNSISLSSICFIVSVNKLLSKEEKFRSFSAFIMELMKLASNVVAFTNNVTFLLFKTAALSDYRNKKDQKKRQKTPFDTGKLKVM